ncbi:MAG TPA: BTAD domain-containing putative transcriptional regulator [Caldilineaceae bacterium]|nr:BTAD domain-containing putative transcriptional regulator [Caldilineaceae bacterium]
MLSINLLGTPEIFLDDQMPLRFRTRKAQALLIYLAATERGWTRDALATLFWPETDDAIARKNLRDILPPLRRQLDDYLKVDDDTIALDGANPYFCDVTTFRQVLEQPLQEIETQRLADTLALYRGEFLEGYTGARISADFELWALRERERLHQLALVGFTTLYRRQQATGNYEVALTTNRQLLKLAPWDEAAHRQQMLLLAQSGQQAAALAHFDACCQILAEELDAEPDAQTIQLYEQIQTGALIEPPVVCAAEPSRPGADQPSTPLAPLSAEVPPFYHNLPGQLTHLIGRSADITHTRNLMLSPEHRLVTVVGEGGIGKTRIALAVAQSFVDEAQALMHQSAAASVGQISRRPQPFTDGIVFVSLAGLTATETVVDQLATAVARALDLQFGGKEPPLRRLHEYLRDKALLLLFDNVEHLLPQAADFFVALLQSTLRLKVLATSRSLLNLQAEVIVRLKGLPTPPPQEATTITPAAALAYGSVALFVERAQRANPTFQITAANQVEIVEICRFVDGMPLAIELAAARIRPYTCRQILTALRQSYTVLESKQRDLAPRHRSLRAMLDYSWQLLSPETAHLLTACSIFHGAFASAAIAAIMGATPEQLYALVDQSLVQLAPGGEDGDEPHFALHELIRQYGAEQLQAQPDERDRLHTGHCRYYLTLLIEQSRVFVHDLAALQRMQNDIDNLRTAWEWAAGQGQWALLAASAHPLRQFYDLLGLYHEAESNFSRTIAQVQQHLPTQSADAGTRQARLVAHLQAHQLHFCRRLSQIAKAEELAQAALAVGRQLDDDLVQSYVYLTLCTIYGLRGDWVGGQRAAEQALVHAQAAAVPLLEVQSLQCVGSLGLGNRQTEQALAYLQRALALYHTATTTGAIERNILLEGLVCLDLGMAYQAAGDLAQAHAYCQQSIDLYRQMRIPILGVNALSYLSELHAQLGSFVQASIDAQMGLEICRAMGGSHNTEATLLGNLAYAYLHLGEWVQADHVCQLLFNRIQPLGATRLQAFTYFLQGEVQRRQNQWQAALAAYESAQQGYTALQQIERAVSGKAKMAHVWQATGDLPKALAKIEEVLPHLTQPLQNSWWETSADYLICYQVLAAAHDPRATGVLQQGYQYVRAQAQRITDDALRHSYLTNVDANRTLVELAAQAGLSGSTARLPSSDASHLA